MTENGFVKIIEREKEVHLLIMEAKGNLLKIPFPKKEKNKIDWSNKGRVFSSNGLIEFGFLKTFY